MRVASRSWRRRGNEALPGVSRKEWGPVDTSILARPMAGESNGVNEVDVVPRLGEMMASSPLSTLESHILQGQVQTSFLLREVSYLFRQKDPLLETTAWLPSPCSYSTRRIKNENIVGTVTSSLEYRQHLREHSE